jgi:hypothetical protein
MNVASNAPSSPTTEAMPTEKVFLKQAGLAKDAFQTFLAVHKLGSVNVIRPALIDLINYTASRSLLMFFLPKLRAFIRLASIFTPIS